MKRLLSLFAALLFVASCAAAQIGKAIAIPAGSDEDHALTAINNAPDGPDKIALIDKFMASYGKGDFELLGDQLYVQTYFAMKDYPKVFEYGDKALALDPDSMAVAVNMVRAADAAGDTERIFSTGEKISQMLARYKAAAPPAGISPDQWAQNRADTLEKAAPEVSYVQYTMIQAAFKSTDPAAKAALFERYVAAYPDSSYSENAREQIAFSYQAARNAAKMVASAQSAVAADPNDASMLILLADYWSDSNSTPHLEEAGTDAKKALGAIQQAKKPDNVTDEQWQQQQSLEKGIAYSCLGQVDAIKGRNATAVEEFKQANPLVQSNSFYYGRNLYRLGFVLAKMRRIAEARAVLTEAVAVDSPYKSHAQETLDKIGGPVRTRKKS
jgi:tetratricopeptide (TPR) repeat protein